MSQSTPAAERLSMNLGILAITGREHWFSGPMAADRDNVPGVYELAHGLAQINRFIGACTRPYSVAEHSLLVHEQAVADGAGPLLQLAALLHDAHECVTGDVATPVKHAIGPAWQVFEDAQQATVLRHYGVFDVYQRYRASIRHWDLRALATERRDLTSFNSALHAAWAVLDTPSNIVEPLSTDLNAAWREESRWNDWRDRLQLTVNRCLRFD